LLKRVNLNLVVPEVVARVNAEALALVELANGLLQWLKEQVRLMVWVSWVFLHGKGSYDIHFFNRRVARVISPTNPLIARLIDANPCAADEAPCPTPV
jgi:hypothetical protein